MKQLKLSGEDVENVKLYLSIMREVQRDYRLACKHIQSREQFLAKQVEALGYGSENLYAADTFRYPVDHVNYNGGLTRICPQEYMLFFAKGDAGWHFNVAPAVRAAEGRTQIMDDRARRLLDSPAGLVLHCAEGLDADIVNILDQVASVVSSSYRPDTYTSRRGKSTTKVQFDA